MVTAKEYISGIMENLMVENNEEYKTEPIVFVEVFVDHDNYQNEVEIDNTTRNEDVFTRKETSRMNSMNKVDAAEVKQLELKKENVVVAHNDPNDFVPITSRIEAGTSCSNVDNIQIKNEPKDDKDDGDVDEDDEQTGEIPGVSIKMEDFEHLGEDSNYVVKVENLKTFDEEREYSEETDEKEKSDHIDIAIDCKIDENSSDNCPFNECLRCSKFESDLASMLKHDCIKKAHSGECVICESISKQVTHMKFHLNTDHDNIVRPVTEPHFSLPFECKWCSKTFVTEYRLEVHKFIHRLIKTYKCRECDKKFVKFESVVKHELLHPELINFPRKAEYLGQLFSCSTCGLKFATPQLLADHKKAHASYFCGQCHMTFSKKYTLAEHIKKKHVQKSKKTSECPKCKRVCHNALTLKRHLRVVHKT